MIRAGENIAVFNKFGGLSRYDAHLAPVQTPPDSQTLKEGLKAFGRFYK